MFFHPVSIQIVSIIFLDKTWKFLNIFFNLFLRSFNIVNRYLDIIPFKIKSLIKNDRTLETLKTFVVHLEFFCI